jgi:DNA-binding transcriptional regulator YiaG
MTPADLRAFRSALGLSGVEFARLVGAADARNVRRWEAGDNDIPKGTVRLIQVLQWLPDTSRSKAVKMLLGNA